MPSYSTNIKGFLQASDSSKNAILQAYFGLVAIELVLKSSMGLKDHDVPSSLKKFSKQYAVGQLAGCKVRLDSLAVQLQNDLSKIIAQGADQRPCPVPIASYPYIRYARFAEDGWPIPVTEMADAVNLAGTVRKIRSHLRQKFQKDL